MKKYQVILLVSALILISISVAVPALASNVTGARWQGTVVVSNNGTNVNNVSANFSLDTAALVSNGFMSSVNDVSIQYGGADVAFMPSVNSSYPWCLFIDSIGQNQNLNYNLSTGNVTGGKLAYFPDTTGMSVPDNATLEPSANFSISMTGYIDTSHLNEFIVMKPSAFGFYVYPSTGNISVYKNGVSSMSTTCSSGEHNIRLYSDGTNLKMDIDGVNVNTEALGAGVTNNSDAWQLGSANATPYIISTNITIGGVLRGSWKWNYAATFPDDSGNGNTATPTFRTTSSDADVSALLTSFAPITEAECTTSTTVEDTGLILGAPSTPITLYTDEDYSKIPGADAINAMIDASGATADERLPRVLWWFPLIFGAIGIAGLCMYGVTTLQGAPGTLWAPIITIEVGYIVAGLLNPIGFYCAILFLIPALTCLTAEKHQSMG